MRSEDQHFISLGGGVGELIHGAAACPLQLFGVAHAARIHASTAQEHEPFTAQYTFEHSLNIVIAVRRPLQRLGCNDRNGHQENGHVRRGLPVPLSAPMFYAGLRRRYAERDRMFFLPRQLAAYDAKRRNRRRR